ncbi:MAG: retropepsin-like aspartic protease family protein [Myxococcota bacterium]
MQRLALKIFVYSAAVAVLLAPSLVAAQTTIDLEKIRKEHASAADEDDSQREDDQSKDDQREDDSESEDESEDEDEKADTIRIESTGGSSTSSFGGQLTLAFDKRGPSMLVPAEIAGKSVYFVFDTGATYTTLTPRFAASIGASPPSNAPQAVSRTANGRRAFRFGIMPSLELDGRVHRNVTFGACSACGGVVYKGRPVVGLLGLNVLRRYRIDFDHSAGEVSLAPGPAFADRSADIKPWLGIQRQQPESTRPDEHEIALEVENRSARDATVELSIDCRFGDGSTATITAGPSRIGAGATETLSAGSGRNYCRVQEIDVREASW